MTCYVPSVTHRGHVHFVDGAGGGYAMAALAMKARRDACGSGNGGLITAPVDIFRPVLCARG